VHPKASWAGLICRTHQYNCRLWLPKSKSIINHCICSI